MKRANTENGLAQEARDEGLARRRAVPAVEHGGPDLQELHRLGLNPSEILDFSACINPYGPAPSVYEALARVAIDQYPDRQAHALRAALANKHGLRPQQILVGNGVSELIWLTALAYVRPKTRVLVLGPTYGEYARSALLQGGLVTTWNTLERGCFTDASQRNALMPHRLVFICNPNNPTGTTFAPDVLLSWAKDNPRTLFVVDEAYLNFVPGIASLVAANVGNLLILRSMTKDYALAGLRVGYAVGSEKVIAALARTQPPWSVNAVAQVAAVAALSDESHLAQSLLKLARAKKAFTQGLMNWGLSVWPSQAHYFLANVGDGAAFRRMLLGHGILVRDAASFGLPACVRLATRRPEENARLLAALRHYSNFKTKA